MYCGEPLSARAVARILGTGVSRVVTVNIHEISVLDHFGTNTTDISLSKQVAVFIHSLSLSSPLILAPDEGALHLAGDVGRYGSWEFDHLEKTRLSGDRVDIKPKSISVHDRDVVIVDDIISTGGTQATAAKMLREQGAKSVHTVGIHGVLASGAYSRLLSFGINSVSCSDTIERACSAFSAAPALKDVLS